MGSALRCHPEKLAGGQWCDPPPHKGISSVERWAQTLRCGHCPGRGGRLHDGCHSVPPRAVTTQPGSRHSQMPPHREHGTYVGARDPFPSFSLWHCFLGSLRCVCSQRPPGTCVASRPHVPGHWQCSALPCPVPGHLEAPRCVCPLSIPAPGEGFMLSGGSLCGRTWGVVLSVGSGPGC